jgi:hypothetical protein
MTRISIVAMTLGILLSAQADHVRGEESNGSNKAARITVTGSSFSSTSARHNAPPGQSFLVLTTEWQNIHPKGKVEKSRLERKADRTMGVGGLGGGKKKAAEYVDVDVAYVVPKLVDHVYILVDGAAVGLHKATEKAPGGQRLKGKFGIARQGEVRELTLVYLVPGNASNLALRLFDYKYGHITVPVKGDMGKARGTGGAPRDALQRAGTDTVEFALLGADLQPDYMGKKAPAGWAFMVVRLGGKSLSGTDVMDIVQFKPKEYVWVRSDGGYLYGCPQSATAANGFVRFTPEVYQLQELACPVPADDRNFSLGIRVRNEVLEMGLTAQPPAALPAANTSYTDGAVMEILVFGSRREGDRVIADLGIRSLHEKGGVDIQAKRQFFLQIGTEEFPVDTRTTKSLLRRPPTPFVVPPGSYVRFELAFDAPGKATALRYRGYEGEGTLKF